MYVPISAPRGNKIILRLRRCPINKSYVSAYGHIQPVDESVVYFGYLAQLITGWETGKEKV